MSENKNHYSKEVQRVYNNRIKNYAKQAIQDLTLLALKLPEDQQAEIFSDKTINPLFTAIIKPTPEQMIQYFENKELAQKKRQNLLPICYNILSQLNDSNLAHLLAPVGTRYMIKEGGELAFLKAIYYRSLNSGDEE
ncbi:MAG TPA: hypothetical protein VLH35_00110 [Candidatus Acidoferrales bacterium]|nr:hypothetical protein [Candidatus Acidoferrales bacterium]